MYNRPSALRLAWAANANTSSFASKIPTVTEPTNDGVITLPDPASCKIRLYPIGLGADNDAASMRMIGWSKALRGTSTPLWIPAILGEFTLTFSAAVGVAGAAVIATERFADTIAPVAASLPDLVIGAGTAIGSQTAIFSRTNDLVAYIEMLIEGFEKLEFTFDQTTNSPTCNVLYQFLGEPA